jgi:arabinofuranosyltransferase
MSRRRYVLIVAMVCALYAAWGGLYIQRTSIQLDDLRVFTLWDDAMVSMRYAANLSQGKGLVWNAGEEPVQGITNLGVTLVMAAAHLLPVGPLRISLVIQILNLLALVVILTLVFRLGRDLFPRSPGVAISSLIGTALCAPLGIWGLQGSDTTLVALWLMVPFAVLARSLRDGREWPAWLWVWIALGSVVRLDCLLYVGVFVLGSWLHPGDKWRRLVVGGGCAALVLAGLLVFGLGYYGDPLPNTYYLKSTGMPQLLMLEHGGQQVLAWWGLLVALVVATYTLHRYRERPLLLQMGAVVLLAVLYTIKVGGDWAVDVGIRFVVPVLPLLLLLATAGCYRLLGGSGQPGEDDSDFVQPIREIPVAAALLVAYFLSPVPAVGEWFYPSVTTLYHEVNVSNVQNGLYIREMTAPETRIAVHFAGVPPYFSERPAVDVLGKSDRHIARMEVEHFAPGHSKWDWTYTLREQRPDVFLHASRGLEERPDFRAGFYRASNADGRRFFVRKGSVGLLRDASIELWDLETGKRVAAR